MALNLIATWYQTAQGVTSARRETSLPPSRALGVSGVTIGTGVDLSQQTAERFLNMGAAAAPIPDVAEIIGVELSEFDPQTRTLKGTIHFTTIERQRAITDFFTTKNRPGLSHPDRTPPALPTALPPLLPLSAWIFSSVYLGIHERIHHSK